MTYYEPRPCDLESCALGITTPRLPQKHLLLFVSIHKKIFFSVDKINIRANSGTKKM